VSCSSERDYLELFESSFDPLWRFIRRRVTAAEDADDVAAEVFTVAWRRRDEWPLADERRLWLYGVARNVLASHNRTNNRQLRLAGRLVELGEVEPGRPAPGMADDTLWRALARLEDADRDLLIMRAWDGLAIPEIASLLDCTANAASIRLTRARAKLRVELERLTEHDEEGTAKEGPGAGHEAGTRRSEETNR